jgi:membrane-bound inhibitor of C-type lysozyme
MGERSLLLLLILSLLAGCATQSKTTSIDYRCDNDFAFRAEFDEQQVRLFLPDKTLTLPRRPDMKGERYVSDDRQTLFLRKGENAVLAVSAGHGVLRCKQNTTP